MQDAHIPRPLIVWYLDMPSLHDNACRAKDVLSDPCITPSRETPVVPDRRTHHSPKCNPWSY